MASVVHFLIALLEATFAFGIVGSAVVVLLTSIEDFAEALGNHGDDLLDREVH